MPPDASAEKERSVRNGTEFPPQPLIDLHPSALDFSNLLLLLLTTIIHYAIVCQSHKINGNNLIIAGQLHNSRGAWTLSRNYLPLCRLIQLNLHSHPSTCSTPFSVALSFWRNTLYLTHLGLIIYLMQLWPT